MIESIKFTNFKVLREAILPLGSFTLLVGPNSSGKTTVLQALDYLGQRQQAPPFSVIKSIGAPPDEPAQVTLAFRIPSGSPRLSYIWQVNGQMKWEVTPPPNNPGLQTTLVNLVGASRTFALYPREISAPSPLLPNLDMPATGRGLAGVLDKLRDVAPERFEALSVEMQQWFPEFDRILFDVQANQKTFSLRLAGSKRPLSASLLSEGTLFGLAILTLAHLPDAPTIIGIEEPERGVHPRLLRQVFSALHRLTHPSEFGDDRPPTQVICTTQSPYFLDLFREHPEEVVISQRTGDFAKFSRLLDLANVKEIIGGAPLGEVWFTGVLGGVPAGQ